MNASRVVYHRTTYRILHVYIYVHMLNQDDTREISHNEPFTYSILQGLRGFAVTYSQEFCCPAW